MELVLDRLEQPPQLFPWQNHASDHFQPDRPSVGARDAQARYWRRQARQPALCRGHSRVACAGYCILETPQPVLLEPAVCAGERFWLPSLRRGPATGSRC